MRIVRTTLYLLINESNESIEKLKKTNQGSNIDDIKSSIEEINKTWNKLSEKMYQDAKQTSETSNGTDPDTGKTEESNIEDADFEVVDKK